MKKEELIFLTLFTESDLLIASLLKYCKKRPTFRTKSRLKIKDFERNH